MEQDSGAETPEDQAASLVQNDGKIKLTIGVPVYNEEAALADFLAALEKNVESLPPHVEVETIACLNGCDDNSEAILRNALNSPLGRNINLKIAHSEKGKLNAQLKVLDERTDHTGPICFLDSDTNPDPDVIAKLLKELEENKNCYLSFGSPRPYMADYESGDLTYFQEALRMKYAAKDWLATPKLKIVHGRAFMMRDDKALRSINDGLDERIKNIDPDVVEGFRLRRGLFIDDIYLSRAVTQRYGVDAISQVRDAATYYHYQQNEAEVAMEIRRSVIELHRLHLLYPEFDAIEPLLDRPELKKKPLPDGEEVPQSRYIDHLRSKLWEKYSAIVAQSINPIIYSMHRAQDSLLAEYAATVVKDLASQDLGSELPEDAQAGWGAHPSTKLAFSKPAEVLIEPDTHERK